MDHPSPRPATGLRRAAGWLPVGLGGYAAVGGLASLLGWAFDLRRLTDWDNNGISIQPNAAVATTAAGLALVLIGLGYRRAAAGLGAAVGLIGGATLAEILTGLDLGIDTVLLFDRPWGRVGTVSPGRMGPPGSVSWTLIGAALVLPVGKRRAVPALGLLVAGLAGLSLTGYLFGADPLYTLPRLTTIALQTATYLFAIGLGLVASAPDREPMRTLLEDTSAGLLARGALPFVIALPVVLGFLRVRGQAAGFYDTAMGTALLILTLIVLICAVLWWGVATIGARERALAAATAARTAADRALRVTELRAVTMLESITDGFVALDREWCYTYVNREAERMVGRDRADLLGRSVWEMFPATVGGRVYTELHRAAAGRVLAEFEVYDPERGRWFSNRAYPTTDGGLSVYFRDVTDRKRDELALRDTHALIEAVNAGTPDLIFAKDRQSRITYMNEATRRVIGRPLADILGRTELEYVGDGAFARAVLANDRRVMADGVAETVEETTPDGRTFLITKAPLRDAAGAVVGLTGVGVDVTGRKQTEEALRDADRRKDAFLATLAHELRNPLAPVRNALEILKRAADPAVAAAARATMERQVAQMVRLIDDLLDVSRINRDQLDLRRERVALAAVLEQAVETCRPMIDRAGHALTVGLPPDPVYLDGDPVRLAQVFGNLLTNACKYTDPGGRLGLAAGRDGDAVVVRVTDTGVGIPADMLARVFDLFTQVGRSRERADGGLGIGLSLAKRLVELHGGTIAAASGGDGRGSEFVVRLPALAGTVEPPVPPAVAPAVSARRILVVDDNRDAAASLALLLQLTGNETRTAHDGLEAVAAAAAYRPDVVLLDLGLPKMSGYDACREIRRQPGGKDLLMVALTGWGQEEDRRQSRAAGFDGHLVKPVDHAALLAVLAGGPAGGTP